MNSTKILFDAKDPVKEKKFAQNLSPTVHVIRVQVTSKNVQDVELFCKTLVSSAKKAKIEVKGPMRMPTKILSIVTRKTPCGEGTKTWDKFKMKIYKRYVDLMGNVEVIKAITNIQLKPDTYVEVLIKDDDYKK